MAKQKLTTCIYPVLLTSQNIQIASVKISLGYKNNLEKAVLFLSYDSRLNFEKGKSIIPMVMTAQLDAH